MDDANNDEKTNGKFLVGKLFGQVEGLEKAVSGFNERLNAKEETDQTRHETQLEVQRKLGERLFDKIDEVKQLAHPAPCAKLTQVCADLGTVKNDVRTNMSKIGTIETTGRVSWKAIVIVAGVTAFILSVILFPLLFFFLGKG